MTTGKETINEVPTGQEAIKEDTKTESSIERCQRKLPVALGKRKLLSPSPSPIKQLRVVEPRVQSAEHCASCNKKLGLINAFTCRCEKTFCSRHRFFDQHNCPFDIKKEAQRRLREGNPKITPKKLSD